MSFIAVYLMVGLAIGIMELISVLFIPDGGQLGLKMLYGLLAALLWPAILVVTWLSILAPKTTERIRVRFGLYG